MYISFSVIDLEKDLVTSKLSILFENTNTTGSIDII